MEPVDLFYSYSHKDETLRDELDTHLALLKKRGVLRTWHDRKISGGDPWAASIDANLEVADIILLLVSADFIRSEYCYDIEMRRALERHEAGEARMLPVIVRDCDIEGAPFARLQALPRDAKPVTSWPNRDEAWTDVAKGIRKVTEELRPERMAHRGGHADETTPAAPPDARAEQAFERALLGFERQVSSAMDQRLLHSQFQQDETRHVAEQLAALPDQKRVLWVDDHPENNITEMVALQKLQIEIVPFRSTAAVLDNLRDLREPCDLVISDWERPPRRIPWQPEGLRLLRKMRKLGIATPVLFYHGLLDADAIRKRRERVLREGGQGATFRPDELIAQVVRLLGAAIPQPRHMETEPAANPPGPSRR